MNQRTLWMKNLFSAKSLRCREKCFTISWHEVFGGQCKRESYCGGNLQRC